jgi:serine-type D-Ala-D-Ala carboxypeptidase (penicillin-binding protein 5/6)
MKAAKLKALIALTLLGSIGYGMDVTAKSAIIVDAESGKVLWARDAETARFPASTTKIMTALLLIERCMPDDVIVAPGDIQKIQESSLHLKPGEKVTAREMLYALMLRSANDGCVAVARHISGSVPKFAELMNKRAKELGCTNTKFNNPNGLNDPLHTTTAHDLAIIARKAMEYDLFREVVKTRKHRIVRSINKDDLTLVSHNKWLAKDPTADGIKTGYTIPAGKCYVGSATRNGYRIITVVLKSQDWQADHKQMLEWAFANHDRRQVQSQGDEVTRVPVSGGEQGEIPAIVGNDVHQVFVKGTPPEVTVTTALDKQLEAPVVQGQKIGTVTFTDRTGWTTTAPLLAGANVEKTRVVPVVGSSSNGFGAIAAFLCVGAYWVRTKSRRLRIYGKATARTRII